MIEGVEAAAIRDAHPEHPKHTLVVPKVCEPDLFALPRLTLDEIWSLVEQVQAGVRRAFPEDGVRIRVNIGAPAGQTVAHAHVHVLGHPVAARHVGSLWP